MSLACDPLEELAKPEKKDEFSATRHLWFLRHDTPWNATYDKRKPGLFKVEWKGDGFVGLNSKTYCCWGTESNKASCKGISKKLNDSEKEVYLVLQTQKNQSGEKRGLTYAHYRTGFSYLYPKRKVLQDGVSTVPLDIWTVAYSLQTSQHMLYSERNGKLGEIFLVNNFYVSLLN